MIRAGQVRGVLVIGSEVYSRILNWQDRGTCAVRRRCGGCVPACRHGSGADQGILSTHLHARAAWAIFCMSMGRSGSATNRVIW